MRALVFSGGGSKGAFQAGVAAELIDLEGRDYDIVAGVSTGAINAAYLAQALPSSAGLYTQAERLVNVWRELGGNKEVYKDWFLLQEAAGVLWKDSFYNTRPLHNLLHRYIKDSDVRASGRKLRLGTVSYDRGEYRVVTENDKDIWMWVAASAAIPGMLHPMRIDGSLWMDGGVRRMTPVRAAIEAGATDIDIVLASPSGKRYYANPEDNSTGTRITGVTVALRSILYLLDEVFQNDLKMARLYNELVEAGADTDKKVVNLRVFEPTNTSILASSLDFGPAKIRAMVLHGRDVAREISSTTVSSWE